MRILVVDDSGAMRAVIRRMLHELYGLATLVFEAESAEEAERAIEGTNFDLVLANWNMPAATGLELLERVRGRFGVRFGFITSDTSEEHQSRARAAGACFVLGKPFTRRALERALDEVLAPPPPASTRSGRAAFDSQQEAKELP